MTEIVGLRHAIDRASLNGIACSPSQGELRFESSLFRDSNPLPNVITTVLSKKQETEISGLLPKIFEPQSPRVVWAKRANPLQLRINDLLMTLAIGNDKHKRSKNLTPL